MSRANFERVRRVGAAACALCVLCACSSEPGAGQGQPTLVAQPDPAGTPAGMTTDPGGAPGQDGAGAVPSAGASSGDGSAMDAAGGAQQSSDAAGENGTAGAQAPAQPSDGLRDVLLVGNSVSGSVSFIDAVTFESLGSVDVIPDLDEVMALIQGDFARAIGYPAVKNGQLLHHFEPSGGDRFVDDVFVSPDGSTLYVSRSNLGDVAAFDLTTADHPLRWRSFVSGFKADHAAISPDGSRLVVSATTTRTAEVFDAATGDRVGDFATGEIPHQNDYSPDGRYIYNSSIGNVAYNAVSYANNDLKGDRWLVKVDAETLQEVGRWEFDWGIRPNVIAADGRTLYTQLSYLNGVVKYDLETSTELGRSDQPLSEFALETYATYDEYPHDSAHHGLALSVDEARLCDCGTIDNTVSIVTTADMQVVRTLDVGMVPYWATNSPDGRHCFVSLSGGDAISVIEYEAAEETTTVPVGVFPQRSRLGRVPEAVIALLRPMAG